MNRVGIFAYADLDGRETIEVTSTNLTTDAFTAAMRRRAATDKTITDWQSSSHDTETEARSCIVGLYGLRWYNKARKQLNALQAAA